MPRKSYDWRDNNTPPTIGIHSLEKHRVLAKYLNRYVHTLAKDPRNERLRLTIVDGFAGGGIYVHPATMAYTPGSPLISIRELRAAEAQVNFERQSADILRTFSVIPRFFFVEKDVQNFQFLSDTLRREGYANLIGQTITLLHGAFEDHVAEIIADIKRQSRSPRAIFILDQYGYKDVPLPMLRQIFSEIPRAEVLLTFAVDSLLNYFSESNAEMFQQVLGRTGFSKYLDINESLEERANGIEWRSAIQHRLIGAIQKGSGADYATPYFIVSQESNRAYWFVHLAKHLRANLEMKNLHWSLTNSFSHYGAPGLEMLGYDPRRDEAILEQLQLIPFDFGENARASSEAALLEELPRFISSCSESPSYEELMGTLANRTPADEQLIKQSIERLAEEGELLVLTPAGNNRRKPGRMQASDRIELRRQLIFDLGGSRKD